MCFAVKLFLAEILAQLLAHCVALGFLVFRIVTCGVVYELSERMEVQVCALRWVLQWLLSLSVPSLTPLRSVTTHCCNPCP